MEVPIVKYHIFALSFLCISPAVHSTSLVYNLKIRRSFAGISTFLKRDRTDAWVLSSLPILYRRTAHVVNPAFATDVHTKRLGGGSICNVRYIRSRYWWAEATTAVQKESVHSKGTANYCASRAGLDDIVLAAGHNMFYGENTQFTLYGLVGFPTRWKTTRFDAQEPLVGTRFYGLGGGAELSYRVIHRDEQNLATILQVRAIHFFTRNWETLFGPGGRIQPGELIDVLLSVRYHHQRTALETGYNATLFVNQAALLPTETIKSKTALRNGTYISFMHLLTQTLGDKPVALGAGFQFNRLGRFDANSYLAWINVTLIF